VPSPDSGADNPDAVPAAPEGPGAPTESAEGPGAPDGGGALEEAPGDERIFRARDTEAEPDTGERVILDAYSGPLDLLLYLIKEHEVDIFDIPVALILEQFLDHLGKIRDLDIDRAGEFLVMASSLMEVKSKMLLPAEAIDEIEAEDPRSELVRQLLEYRRFKQAAIDLEGRAGRRRLRFGRLMRERFDAPQAEAEADADPSELFEDVNLYHIAAAYEALMRETMGGGPAQLVYDDVSIEERIEEILALLRERPVRGFGEFFEEPPESNVEGRLDVVGTFLACLELTRRKLVRVLQAGDGADITVQVRPGDETDDLRPLSLDELEGRIERPIRLEGEEADFPPEREEAPDAGILTRESVALALRKLGLAEGDLVMVHASFRSLGPVDGGARAIALAVCDAVGESGTVVMPTFTDWKPGLDPDPGAQKMTTGELPAAFADIPGTLRDRHFCESCAYRGPRAEELSRLNERRAYPVGGERMVVRLAELGGKVLLVGVGYGAATAVAAGEELSRSRHPDGRRSLSHLTIEELLALDAKEQEKLHKKATGGRERDYGKVEPTVVSMGIETVGEIGEAEVRLADARKLVETAAGALDANPDLLIMSKKEVIARRRSGSAGAERRRHFKGIKRSEDLQEIDREEAELRRRVDRALKKADEASERIEAMREGQFTAKSLQDVGMAPAEGEGAEPVPEGALTRDVMADKFRKLGIEEGDILVVHSSFKSLGTVYGGPQALIAALLDVVGEMGTLLMPAFTRYEPGGPADPTLMRAWTGITGLTLSRMAGAVRSRHPVYSWAIYGPLAHELATIDNALTFCWGENRATYRTAQLGGKVVLIGVDHKVDSTIHIVEELADVPYLGVKHENSGCPLDEFLGLDDETQKELIRSHRVGPKRDFAALEKPLVAAGVQKRGRLGDAWVRVVTQVDVLRVGLEVLREDPAFLVAEEDRGKEEWPVAPPSDEAFARVPVLESEAEPADETPPEPGPPVEPEPPSDTPAGVPEPVAEPVPDPEPPAEPAPEVPPEPEPPVEPEPPQAGPGGP